MILRAKGVAVIIPMTKMKNSTKMLWSRPRDTLIVYSSNAAPNVPHMIQSIKLKWPYQPIVYRVNNRTKACTKVHICKYISKCAPRNIKGNKLESINRQSSANVFI